MKFCMLTSFFGPHSFGGDSAYVDRLSRALVRRGHLVDVIYCRDAFELVRGDFPEREYTPAQGVRVHGLRSKAGALSPLWTQQTGHPGPKWNQIKSIIQQVKPDVVHFHNLSLIGGPGLLMKDFGNAVKMMTAHEHWLVCPMHVLWKNSNELCGKPSCHRCSIASGRPPQFWRHSGLMEKGLKQLDRLIVPSQSARAEHQKRGVSSEIEVLPYFLPDDWPFAYRTLADSQSRPYFGCVGRIEMIKGFQDVIEVMRRIPQADLRIAGHGGYIAELKKMADGMPNVIFEGILEGEPLRHLMRHARAMVVPSLVPETFGYVVLESLAQGRPVIGRNLGALPEILAKTEGGVVFENQNELEQRIMDYLGQPHLAESDGQAGRNAIDAYFREETHLEQYFQLIQKSRLEKPELKRANANSELLAKRIKSKMQSDSAA